MLYEQQTDMRRRQNNQDSIRDTEMSVNSITPNLEENASKNRNKKGLWGFWENWLVPFWHWINGRQIRELEALKVQIRVLMEAKTESDSKLRSAENANDTLQKEKEQLLKRLSDIAGTKLKYNNPGIADLSDDNRPNKLAEKLSELYDNEWTEAYEKIQKDIRGRDPVCPESTVIKRLLQILKEVYTECKRMAEQQRKTMEAVAVSPTLQTTDNQKDEKNLSQQISDTLKKKVSDFQKDISNFTVVNVQQSFLEDDVFITSHNFEVKHCKSYVTKCIELCWYMNIQGPPLLLDFSPEEGQTYNNNIWRPYTTSGDVVEIIVWPALFLHDKGPLLCKGVLQPKTMTS